jgi:hypothetical protein
LISHSSVQRARKRSKTPEQFLLSLPKARISAESGQNRPEGTTLRTPGGAGPPFARNIETVGCNELPRPRFEALQFSRAAITGRKPLNLEQYSSGEDTACFGLAYASTG